MAPHSIAVHQHGDRSRRASSPVEPLTVRVHRCHGSTDSCPTTATLPARMPQRMHTAALSLLPQRLPDRRRMIAHEFASTGEADKPSIVSTLFVSTIEPNTTKILGIYQLMNMAIVARWRYLELERAPWPIASLPFSVFLSMSSLRIFASYPSSPRAPVIYQRPIMLSNIARTWHHPRQMGARCDDDAPSSCDHRAAQMVSRQMGAECAFGWGIHQV